MHYTGSKYIDRETFSWEMDLRKLIVKLDRHYTFQFNSPAWRSGVSWKDVVI